MATLWNTPGIPHKGWHIEEVIDIRQDGQSTNETVYETCMMCGHEKIRYVHILSHTEIAEQYRVGCDCAEKMTNDYSTPKKLEAELKNKAARRLSWINKEWKYSKNGNPYLNKENHHILIYYDKVKRKYSYKINNIWRKPNYEFLREVKLAIFDDIESMRENGLW